MASRNVSNAERTSPSCLRRYSSLVIVGRISLLIASAISSVFTSTPSKSKITSFCLLSILGLANDVCRVESHSHGELTVHRHPGRPCGGAGFDQYHCGRVAAVGPAL